MATVAEWLEELRKHNPDAEVIMQVTPHLIARMISRKDGDADKPFEVTPTPGLTDRDFNDPTQIPAFPNRPHDTES